MNGKKATILIVDDNPVNIQMLYDILKDHYQLKIAISGPKAIAIMKNVTGTNDEIDLILLDIIMPDLDGYQTCKELKANNKTNKVPIIFVTAKNEVVDEELGFNLGAVDYISKPYHPAIIKARVRNQLSIKFKTDMLEDLAHIDGLTRVYNRRQLDIELPLLFTTCLEHQHNLTIAILDVDFFKNYNDNYGHGMGDVCLIEVANCLKKSLINITDSTVYRYGGEEFVIIIPKIPTEEAVKFITEVVAKVADLKIKHEYSLANRYVTISAGVASCIPYKTITGSDYTTFADLALYQAKRNGRNQLALSEFEYTIK